MTVQTNAGGDGDSSIIKRSRPVSPMLASLSARLACRGCGDMDEPRGAVDQSGCHLHVGHRVWKDPDNVATSSRSFTLYGLSTLAMAKCVNQTVYLVPRNSVNGYTNEDTHGYICNSSSRTVSRFNRGMGSSADGGGEEVDRRSGGATLT